MKEKKKNRFAVFGLIVAIAAVIVTWAKVLSDISNLNLNNWEAPPFE